MFIHPKNLDLYLIVNNFLFSVSFAFITDRQHTTNNQKNIELV